MQAQGYLHTDVYHAMLDRLEQIVTSHDHDNVYDVSMLRTRFIEALGEVGGIWPASVYQGEDAGPSVFVMV